MYYGSEIKSSFEGIYMYFGTFPVLDDNVF